jgi:hypothetical protein
MNLTARSDPKDLQAAWASKATAQIKMLMLICRFELLFRQFA